MSLYCAVGSEHTDLSPEKLNHLLTDALSRLGPRSSVLAIPPDITRLHSQAGMLTRFAWQHYGAHLKAVLPALGTHVPLRPDQLTRMFGDMPQSLFRVHNWRTDIETVGEVPAEFIREQSEGKLDFAWPAQVNRMLLEGGFDLDPVDRAGGAPRSHRHGQLQQEHPGGHRRARRHQSQPLSGRGLRHGAHHGAGRESCSRCAQLCLRSLSAPCADRVCADGGGPARRWHARRARALHRRRPGMLSCAPPT